MKVAKSVPDWFACRVKSFIHTRFSRFKSMVLVLYRLKFYVYFFILTAFILYMGYVFNYVYTRYPQWKKIAQDLEAEEENKVKYDFLFNMCFIYF